MPYSTDRTLSEVRMCGVASSVTAWRTTCLYGVSHRQSLAGALCRRISYPIISINQYLFASIIYILLKNPSYSLSNIFQIPLFRPPSLTISFWSESCLRYRCTCRKEMPMLSDICIALIFGI